MKTAKEKPDKPRTKSYILATATTGGTFYPVGVALATLTKVKLQPETGISLSAISSAGSAENVKLMRSGEAPFAILQGLYVAWSWTGTGRMEVYGKQTHMRSVTRLWPNVEHVLVRSALAKTGTMDDIASMRGRKFSIGKRNSGAEGSNTYILEALGFKSGRDFLPVYQGYGPSADALQDGRISAMSSPAGPPISAITRVMAARGESIRLLNFTETHLKKINAKFSLWRPYIIPANTYPGQTEDVMTIAYPNVLVVRADVEEETVYHITKAIYENLDFLSNIHRAVRDLSLETAIDGLTTPLHPGAIRYYRERQLRIPDHLNPLLDSEAEAHP